MADERSVERYVGEVLLVVTALLVLAGRSAARTGLLAALPPMRRVRRSPDADVRGAAVALLTLFGAPGLLVQRRRRICSPP